MKNLINLTVIGFVPVIDNKIVSTVIFSNKGLRKVAKNRILKRREKQRQQDILISTFEALKTLQA